MGTLTNPFVLPNFSKDKHVYMGLFDVEKWYESIQHHTFATSFIPLTKDEATTMTLHYKVHQLKYDASLWTEDHKTILANAITKLNTQMVHHSSCFVRLSTRSPKDAGLFNDQQFRTMVQQELIQIMEHSIDTPDPNEQLMAVFSISSKQLESKTADQAMALLLDSERIYTDLRHSLENDIDWEMKFIVREYVTLDVSYEFRGFACNNTLTALSQYNNLCYYPHFQDKEEILDRIVNFYNQICTDVHYTAYVIDFVVIGEIVRVIEINPFGPMTGASLFNWNYDRHTLQGGVDLFGDAFGEAKNTGTPPTNINLNDNTDNNNNNMNSNNNINSDNTNKTSESDPTNNGFKDYHSTHVFSNGWRTVLRINQRNPEFITHEYVNTMFSGVFGASPKKLQVATPKQKQEKSDCITM